MSVEFQSTGLENFQKALNDYELASRKTRAEVLAHRAQRFAFALYREAQTVGRATIGRIKGIRPSEMKVRSGNRTQAQEKARRIFAAGFVASGWLPSIKRFKQSGNVNALAKVKVPQGGVVIAPNYIDLINSTPGAVEADAKYAMSDKAAQGQADDMQRYLDRKDRENLSKTWGN